MQLYLIVFLFECKKKCCPTDLLDNTSISSHRAHYKLWARGLFILVKLLLSLDDDFCQSLIKSSVLL